MRSSLLHLVSLPSPVPDINPPPGPRQSCFVDHLLTKTDVDILSTSCIHQGVPHVDFSLKIELPEKNDAGA